MNTPDDALIRAAAGHVRTLTPDGLDDHNLIVQLANALAERSAQLEADAKRLLWFVVDGSVDMIGDVDIHEEASINASALGRDEPNDADYITAMRTAIDAALRPSSEGES